MSPGRAGHRAWWWGLGALVAVVGLPLAARGVRDLTRTRGAVTTYARLVASANAGDLGAVRDLCSARFARAHPPEPAPSGGVVGFPRQVHPNFRAWVAGDDVLFCPANRVGTVYRFAFERGAWRYDGPAGLLRPDGRIVPVAIQGEAEEAAGVGGGKP